MADHSRTLDESERAFTSAEPKDRAAAIALTITAIREAQRALAESKEAEAVETARKSAESATELALQEFAAGEALESAKNKDQAEE